MAALKEQFEQFDKDGSGFLERDECIAALAKLGSKLSFEEIDSDGDAKISFEEFTMITQLSATHAHQIFKSAKGHAGRAATGISAFAGEAHLIDAFMQTASKAWRKAAPALRAEGMTEKALKVAFKRMDRDQTGYLDESEIRKTLKMMAPQLTDVDICLMMACADNDADGQVSEEEFVTMMQHNHEADVPYWEKYGKRDMHTGHVMDRSHQVRY